MKDGQVGGQYGQAKLVPTMANLAPKTSFDFPRRFCKMSTKALPLRAGPSKIGLAWPRRYEGLSMGIFNVLSRCYLLVVLSWWYIFHEFFHEGTLVYIYIYIYIYILANSCCYAATNAWHIELHEQFGRIHGVARRAGRCRTSKPSPITARLCPSMANCAPAR